MVVVIGELSARKQYKHLKTPFKEIQNIINLYAEFFKKGNDRVIKKVSSDSL